MNTTDRVLLRIACFVVILGGLYGAMQMYASHYRSRTHDTVAQRKASTDCIAAGGGVEECDAKYDGPQDQCEDAVSMKCFATIFKNDGE